MHLSPLLVGASHGEICFVSPYSRASWPGFVPAIHAVRRTEHSQAGGRTESSLRYKPLRLVAPKSHSCLRGRGVDGRGNTVTLAHFPFWFARSEATWRSSDRRAAAVALDRRASLAMTTLVPFRRTCPNQNLYPTRPDANRLASEVMLPLFEHQLVLNEVPLGSRSGTTVALIASGEVTGRNSPELNGDLPSRSSAAC